MPHDLPRAFRLFSDAVLAFSNDPGPENLERYLAASRTLEELRRSGRSPAQARPRTKGSGVVLASTVGEA
jgi:hypothetical protein